MLKAKVGDIKLGYQEKKKIKEVIASGYLSEGPKVKEFEKRWAEATWNKYTIAVNSGTSALIAGLFALLYDERFPKVKKGAKVITSPVTYIATSSAIVHAGLEPVYVDIDPLTFKLDVKQIKDLLAEGNVDEYCMILPVHLMGYPNDMLEINEIADKNNLVVFEDAAQSHGSLYKGKPTGSWSLLADYSFYIAHNIQVGEMGAVVTNDKIIKEYVRKIKTNGRVCSCDICTRSHGKCPYKEADFDPRFIHDLIGFNFKTTEFQAAIAIPQIINMQEIIKKRQHNVRTLNEVLAKFSHKLQLPLYSEEVSYLAYPMVIKDKSINRESIMRFLEKKGIETRPLFGCIPTQQKAFAYLKDIYAGKLPFADNVGLNGFYIGCHQYLKKGDFQLIEKAFAEYFAKI